MASLTTLPSTLPLNGTMTITSTPREIMFSICEICVASEAFAEVTVTVAPSDFAAAVK